MLTLKEVHDFLGGHEGWFIDGNTLAFEKSFERYDDARRFVESVGKAAVALQHFPTLLWDINKVKITTSTYLQNGEQGIDELDKKLAEEIEKEVGKDKDGI